MEQPNRQYTNSQQYRYGFNGKENDKEWGTAGLTQDYGFRLYNPALAKFLSVDPLAPSYPWNSTYAFAEGDVIRCIDLDGLEKLNFRAIWNNKTGQLILIQPTQEELEVLNKSAGAFYYAGHGADFEIVFKRIEHKDAHILILNTDEQIDKFIEENPRADEYASLPSSISEAEKFNYETNYKIDANYKINKGAEPFHGATQMVPVSQIESWNLSEDAKKEILIDQLDTYNPELKIFQKYNNAKNAEEQDLIMEEVYQKLVVRDVDLKLEYARENNRSVYKGVNGKFLIFDTSGKTARTSIVVNGDKGVLTW